MSKNRPFVLSIAGLDPSGGAGILADVKTFEQLQVTGFAISTANTIQTESRFYEILWTDLDFVIRSIETLFENYKIETVKIGIIPSLSYLNSIVSTIKQLSPNTKIVWDTVLKSSTEFDFISIKNQELLEAILSKIDLITPNYNEIRQLFPDFLSGNFEAKKDSTTPILLKGGHNAEEVGTDYLYLQNETHKLLPSATICYEKHGSGCVLSSAITANLALGQSVEKACKNAKIYIEKYLNSSTTLIGYHYVP
ncbi:hydroxymethylpyrimidine/phosphomethylpyrimidine kinase [Flavobacterium geliluteum]|uniref:hydroxymethylpyrimidine kinase n=1 Tax=Flavobacterium geliluteum TaxID=2816120 RepID=A0A940X587_9FLAO|nr:hydroxymethylpyrimidine/phosphomethylpyrimidine kinase [Flavobacterium geliluteum]MBP4136504.1 hydroxymethylpyrimidine/phosphomethylpyrimidine kinase [Flavobacterium geliluteum]